MTFKVIVETGFANALIEFEVDDEREAEELALEQLWNYISLTITEG